MKVFLVFEELAKYDKFLEVFSSFEDAIDFLRSYYPNIKGFHITPCCEDMTKVHMEFSYSQGYFHILHREVRS